MRTVPLIAGATICVFAGYALAMGTHVTLPGADAGDWLTAGAGAVGVMLTVLVAVGIEQWRATAGPRAALARLVAAAEEVDGAIRDIEAIPEWNGEPATRQGALAAERRLLKAISKYRFVASNVNVTEVELWDAMGEMEQAIQGEYAMLSAELGTLDQAGENPNVFKVNRQKVQEGARRIGDSCGGVRFAAATLSI